MDSLAGITPMSGLMILNSILISLLLFLLYRIIKRSDRYGELDTKLQLLNQGLSQEVRQLGREVDKAKIDHASLRDVHQYFGVIKQNHTAVFKRIDELRTDIKELNTTVTGEISSLRKDYYEIKAKVEANA